MNPVSIRTQDRIRLEFEYADYKEWERILGANAEEHTTRLEGGSWWKVLYLKVGETEFRFTGPLMLGSEGV